MSTARVYSKSEQLAGREVKRPGRQFEIKAATFTGSEQGVPVRLLRGTAKVAGVYITPVFGFTMVETAVEQEK